MGNQQRIDTQAGKESGHKQERRASRPSSSSTVASAPVVPYANVVSVGFCCCTADCTGGCLRTIVPASFSPSTDTIGTCKERCLLSARCKMQECDRQLLLEAAEGKVRLELSLYDHNINAEAKATAHGIHHLQCNSHQKEALFAFAKATPMAHSLSTSSVLSTTPVTGQ